MNHHSGFAANLSTHQTPRHTPSQSKHTVSPIITIYLKRIQWHHQVSIIVPFALLYCYHLLCWTVWTTIHHTFPTDTSISKNGSQFGPIKALGFCSPADPWPYLRLPAKTFSDHAKTVPAIKEEGHAGRRIHESDGEGHQIDDCLYQ